MSQSKRDPSTSVMRHLATIFAASLLDYGAESDAEPASDDIEPLDTQIFIKELMALVSISNEAREGLDDKDSFINGLMAADEIIGVIQSIEGVRGKHESLSTLYTRTMRDAMGDADNLMACSIGMAKENAKLKAKIESQEKEIEDLYGRISSFQAMASDLRGPVAKEMKKREFAFARTLSSILKLEDEERFLSPISERFFAAIGEHIANHDSFGWYVMGTNCFQSQTGFELAQEAYSTLVKDGGPAVWGIAIELGRTNDGADPGLDVLAALFKVALGDKEGIKFDALL